MNDPPVARKDPKPLEIHGRTLIDNYAWLRNKESSEVLDYLKQENAYTEYKTEHLKGFEAQLFDEMKARINEDDMSAPTKRGDYYYYFRTEKDKQYRIYCRKHGKDGEEEIILDVNKEAVGHNFFNAAALMISPDQSLLAYTVDTKGSEFFMMKIKNLNTGEYLTDQLEDVYETAVWGSNTTLYYTTFDSTRRPCRVWKHQLGTPTENDTLLHYEDDNERFVYAEKSRDEKYIFISANATISSEVRYLNLTGESTTPTVFLKRETEHEYEMGHRDGYFYLLSNRNAVNFKFCRTTIDDIAEDHWETVIEHSPDIRLETFHIFKNFIIIVKRADGLVYYTVYYPEDPDKSFDIHLPHETYSTETRQGLNLEYDQNWFRFWYSSLTYPPTIYDYDIDRKELIMQKQDEVIGYNPNNYLTKRIYATARDGVKVPISIVYQKGLEFPAPLLQYAYGSYGYSTDPALYSPRVSLYKRGIIYAIAHIRGGSEMGRQWYLDGKMMKKKNTFYDFIDCAEHLIKIGMTNKGLLAIRGGSAGGLLMGAVVNMRPDLFRVVFADVPFVDVINTMLDESIPLTSNEWKQWGNPKIKDEFEYMLSYSPIDNVVPKDYPEMVVTAGLNDSRVAYWEPAKWVAKLRATKTDNHELLLKTNMEAGHHGSTGRYDYLKEIAFRYALLIEKLTGKIE